MLLFLFSLCKALSGFLSVGSILLLSKGLTAVLCVTAVATFVFTFLIPIAALFLRLSIEAFFVELITISVMLTVTVTSVIAEAAISAVTEPILLMAEDIHQVFVQFGAAIASLVEFFERSVD